MCGFSTATVRNEHAELHLGYYGGSLTVMDMQYSVGDGESELTREQMKQILESFTAQDLAELLLQFVDNAEEA